MTLPLPGHIFVSYSRDDHAYVTRLARHLEAKGLRVWRDTSGLAPGDRVEETIRQAITDSVAIVVVLSPAAVTSEWVKDETSYADTLGKPVLPVLLRAFNARHAPMRLQRLQREDVTGGRMPSEAYVNTLRGLSGQPPLTTSPQPLDLQTRPPLDLRPPPRPRRSPTVAIVTTVAIVLACGGGAYGLSRLATALSHPRPGPLAQFQAHLDRLESIAVSPDCRTLALTGEIEARPQTGAVLAGTADDDGSTELELWNVADPANPGFISAVEVSPSGGTIDAQVLTFSPDGDLIVTGRNVTRGSVGIPTTAWSVSDPANPQAVWSRGDDTFVEQVAWLGSTRTAIWAEYDSLSIVDFTDPSSPRFETRSTSLDQPLLVVSPDGQFLASAQDKTLTIRDVGTWNVLGASDLPEDITTLAFGGSPRSLVVGTRAGVSLWSLSDDLSQPPSLLTDIDSYGYYAWVWAIGLQSGPTMVLAGEAGGIESWLVDGLTVTRGPDTDSRAVAACSDGVVATAQPGATPATITIAEPFGDRHATTSAPATI